jgi:chemotaxis protein MotA
MDLATLIGLVLGFGGLLGGFLLEGGELHALLILSPFIIVMGGTSGAVAISFTMDELKKVPYFIKRVFVGVNVNYQEIMESLVSTADRARREGLLSIENQLGSMDNAFMVRSLQVVIDGTDPELARGMLEMEIEAYEKEQKVGSDIFNTAGGYSPTMGIIGTVMGLVHVLGNMSTPEALAPAIAAAFIATLYGVGFANVAWLPIGSKIKVKANKELLMMEMIMEGVLSIQAGENPRVISEKLATFLPSDIRKNVNAANE